jgi:hypothetical protein
MSHPLVDQLRFTRREWLRGLAGVSTEDATSHFGRMNCIGWIVGHMAWHEQRSWLQRLQGIILYPVLNVMFAYVAPMNTPVLPEMLESWQAVTREADPFLDSLTTDKLMSDLPLDGRSVGQSIGSMLRRVTYQYWYHIGEIQAIRQMLGHPNLPDFVGEMDVEAPYRSE